MRKWILALVLLALVVPGLAEEKSTITGYGIDLNTIPFPPGPIVAPDLVYCRTLGENLDPWGNDIQMTGNFVQSGPTLTDATGNGAFINSHVGDLVFLLTKNRTTGTISDRVARIASLVDANNVTVLPSAGAATWTKIGYRYTQCSDGLEAIKVPAGYPFGEPITEVGGAWVNVLNWESVMFSIKYENGDVPTGVGFAFECRTRPWSGALPAPYIEQSWGVQVYPGTGSTCGFGTLATDICVLTNPANVYPPGRPLDSQFSYQIANTQNFYECRIGVTCAGVDCGSLMWVNTSITVNRQEVK